MIIEKSIVYALEDMKKVGMPAVRRLVEYLKGMQQLYGELGIDLESALNKAGLSLKMFERQSAGSGLRV